MSKRIYRTVSVKNLDWKSVQKQVAGLDRLVLCIDVAKQDQVAVLQTPEEERVAMVSWKHPQETREMVAVVQDLPVASVEVVLEPSGTYGDSIRQSFQRAGCAIFWVSPKHVADSQEAYDGVPSSHDAKSAAVLGWLHRVGRSKVWQEPSQRQRSLSASLLTVELHGTAFVAARSRLEAQLARYWPELQGLLALGTASFLELIAAYGSPRSVALSRASARELLERVSRGALESETIERILKSAGTSLGVEMVEAERMALMELAQEARRRQQADQEARRRLRSISSSDETQRQLGATVGEVTAAVLEADLGALQDYPSPGQLLKASGLNLKERSSGKRKGQLAITKRGSGRVRQWLYLAVLRWIQHDSRARSWYERKVMRDGGKVKRKAIIALMRKLLRGLWWVAQGHAFDSSKLFAALPREQAVLAAS